jgi:hypothetical protein
VNSESSGFRDAKFLKEPTNALVFKNVFLLHINRRYVSATPVAIFRVKRTRILRDYNTE